MSLALAEFTEKLVSISDFSQGKAGKIFSDVADNNREYVVLKNNQPTAVVISVQEYKDTQKKVAMLEEILEKIEISTSKKMLTAAALTYVASVTATILEILRLLIAVGGRND